MKDKKGFFICPFCDTKVFDKNFSYHDDCKIRWNSIRDNMEEIIEVKNRAEN